MSACITVFILHLMCYESSSAYVAMWGLMIALYQLLFTAADLSQWHFLDAQHFMVFFRAFFTSVVLQTGYWKNCHDITILVNNSADFCQFHEFFCFVLFLIIYSNRNVCLKGQEEIREKQELSVNNTYLMNWKDQYNLYSEPSFTGAEEPQLFGIYKPAILTVIYKDSPKLLTEAHEGKSGTGLD